MMVYFLKQNSDTAETTARFLADVAPYGTVKCIRSNDGHEFTCKKFRSLLVKNQIKHEKSAPYSPHQNGTVKRAWRSLFDIAKMLWTYTVMAATYIRNRCYNLRTKKTQFEVFTGQKPNLSNMRLFETKCFSYVQNKKTLDARSKKGIFCRV